MTQTRAGASEYGPVNGRVWLVTGASSGFGRSIVEAALERGDTVVATARRPETLDDLVSGAPGGCALGLDVTDVGNVRAVVGDVLSRFGRIDVLDESS